MLFVWIALWTVSVLLLAANCRNTVGRWLSLVAFCGGTGALAPVIEGWIAAMTETGRIDAGREHLLRILQRGCSWASYYGLPYGFVCFAAAYNSGALRGNVARLLPLAAAIPPVVMLAVPVAENTPVHFEILAIWAIPYMIVGAGLLALKRSLHPADRRAHAVLMAAVLPAVLIALTMNYVLPLFGLYGMWRYNVWPIAFAFIVFIVALFKFGFLGVQLLIERRQLDFSLRAITSGTAMLNHAIKNDIGKIKLFSDKIKREAGAGQELLEDIRVIATAAAHIEEMIRSVHERTQELQLMPREIALAELVRDQLAALKPQLDERIILDAQYDEQAAAFADPAQTSEAVNNVLQNAVEAMPHGGELGVKVFGGKRGATIEVSDTGSGIDKGQLHKVMQPFYTTKGGKSMNFGLGLAFCYQLMNRQGGELKVRSDYGKGTVVSFHFPTVKRTKGAKG
ncbi:HAMP domain-containing histidine kinase [Paenibacillus sp. sptzw28]|uniref:sensor histidine kinase n=1 Tax=Paenibacillus sp. sptzw28 TaxID=715179 RepID=UPI001C6EE364|nr:HAMP domain-containing sensor histidine kinase [Paenibacillus sp. sptzw28]QYR22848.1 HAMP domain-containing histidine kinase [Paenibacillus sp. sptzw28]